LKKKEMFRASHRASDCPYIIQNASGFNRAHPQTARKNLAYAAFSTKIGKLAALSRIQAHVTVHLHAPEQL
jgi:hypothetical protein